MQSFLPEPSFEESMRALDSVRLNSNLKEGGQILDAIARTPSGPDGKVFAGNHPATNQWRGYEHALVTYLRCNRDECRRRGVKWDVHWANITFTWLEHFEDVDTGMPSWWTNPEQRRLVNVTHRASLYRKDPVWYEDYQPEFLLVEADPVAYMCCATRRAGKPCGYFWPAHNPEKIFPGL